MSTVTATPSKAALLASLPKTPKGKKESNTPVVQVPSDIEAVLREMQELRLAMADGKARLDMLSTQVAPVAETLRRQESVKAQAHLSSVSLMGIALWESQRKCTIPLTEEARLRPMFNGKFDDFFKQKTVVTVDVDKMSDEALALLVRDGAASEVTVLKPTEALYAARSTDPNTAALCDAATIQPTSFLKWS